jgi:monofunctional biosynthetic peptidoglycan transglycosylase
MAGRSRLSRGLLWLLRSIAILAATFLVASVALVLTLRHVDPPITSFMIEARVAAWFESDGFTLRHEWRDIGAISPEAATAVVAAEDQLFPYHAGFDLKSIRRAVQTNEEGGRTRGASTITQQVAKNLFLWPGRSYLRKGIEAWFTLLMEWLWPKQRILEIYLNTAEFGRGIYGVQSAARVYFNVDAAQLRPAQAALLAAVLPNPRRYRVDRPGPYVLQRRDEIVRQMHALGGRNWLRGVLPSKGPPN